MRARALLFSVPFSLFPSLFTTHRASFGQLKAKSTVLCTGHARTGLLALTASCSAALERAYDPLEVAKDGN